MGESSAEIDEQVKKFFAKEVSRGTFNAGAAAGAVGTVVAMIAGREVGRAAGQKIREALAAIGNAIELQGLTQAQKEAAVTFNATKPEDRLRNLEVIDPNGANLRSEPRVPPDKEDNVRTIVGHIDVGHKVAEAISVIGQSPNIPGQKETWYAFPLKVDPKTQEAKIMVFTYPELFK